MDLLILIILLLIFIETTILVARKVRSAHSGRRKIYVDTSVLIDGRIVTVAETGFLDGDFIILKSVLLELQLLADSRDNEKRTRARIGLDNVSALERVEHINTEVVDDTGGLKKVDEELLKYAKGNKGAILTVDYNLIKVAEAEKIQALNMNDLALATRIDFTPGEKIKIKITEPGSNKAQGVGHLPNGTMVVVDNAVGRIGQEATVELIRLHETSSGKMIFAKLVRAKKS